MSHKILIELDNEAYEYWQARAEREERSMQALISSMMNLFPKARAMADTIMGRVSTGGQGRSVTIIYGEQK